MLAAAEELDQKVTPKVLERGAAARELRQQGMEWKEIARRLGVAQTTAIYYAQKEAQHRISPRRTIIACLVGQGSGTRSSAGSTSAMWTSRTGTSTSEDAKTEAGVRKVDLSPMLLDDLLAWRASLVDPAPDSPFFPTRTGNRRTKDNINARVLRPALRRANERRAERGLPALPRRVTAHTLRRTYISMTFAAAAELPYVIGAGRP